MNPTNAISHRVRTAVRVRPPAPYEDNFLDASSNLLRWGNTLIPFSADYLFGTGATQECVFDIAVKSYLDKFLRAEDNITFIAFGSKFAGKTFTMFGPGFQFTDSAAFYGMYPRLATYLFSQFDASLFAGNNPTVTVHVTFIEVDKCIVKNLLENTVLTEQLGQQAEAILSGYAYSQCKNARDMINCLHIALQNRQPYPTHVMAIVVIEQPVLQKDGEFKPVRTSAVFADIGSTLIEQTVMLDPFNQCPVHILEDQFILNKLALSHGGTLRREVEIPDQNHLFSLLKSAFDGTRATMVLCCISPDSVQSSNSSRYLKESSVIDNMKARSTPVLAESLDVNRNMNQQCNKASSLISEAESLLSRLSVTEEDREKLKNWLTMKKECEDDSLNAQSHGQLECIEEVTESEEEIASSNEKMSVSPVSLDDSLSESDQEEGDSKVCHLSDSNFVGSLDNMCVQFNTLVDKFVDSFKAKTSLSPAKERKRDYSAARRGGMSELPKVNELQAKLDTFSASLDLTKNVNQSSQHSDTSSLGCIKKTTCEQETKARPRYRDRRSQTIGKRGKGRYSDSSSTDEEQEMGARVRKLKEPAALPRETRVKDRDEQNQPEEHPEEEINPDNEKYITWSMMEPPTLSDYDLCLWLKRHRKELKEILNTWKACIDQHITAEVKGKEGETKALQSERNRQMFFAITSIDPFIDMMKENLELDYTYLDDADCGFNHFIRWHRFTRRDFNRHKSKLETNVKNKTATDEELRDYLMADEMVETLDSCIEFLNYMILNNKPAQQKLPNTLVGQDVLSKLKSLTSLEMRNLLFKYFVKVVDLRESSKQMETVIADYEQKMEFAQSRINSLTRALQDMRSQQSQLQAQAVSKYSGPNDAYGGHTASPPTLALPEGSKGSRSSTIPRHNLNKLQAIKTPPTPHVHVTRDKIIITNYESKL